MEKTRDAGDSISVEAKEISFLRKDGSFLLKEVHKKGERSITLTEKQSKWIQEGFVHQCRKFGRTRRKESVDIDGETVVISEGSNKNGIFISINFQGNRDESNFVIIPSGSNGVHWKRVSMLIGNRRSIGNQQVNHHKTYANAVRSSTDQDFRILHEQDLKSLTRRVELLENEIHDLRSRAETSIGKDYQEEARCGGSLDVSSHHSRLQAATTSSNPSELGKKGILTAEIDLDREAVINCAAKKSPVSCQADLFVTFLRLSEDIQRVLIWLKSPEGANPDSKHQPQTDPDINLNQASRTSVSSAGENDSDSLDGSESGEDEEEDIPSDRSSHSSNDDDVLSNDSSSKSSIIWDKEEEVYVHSCGMMHDPLRNSYFIGLELIPNDLRSLYFVPKDGVLQFAIEGKLGDINKQILREEGWGACNTTPEWIEAPPPNLLEMFRKKSIEDEISNM